MKAGIPAFFADPSLQIMYFWRMKYLVVFLVLTACTVKNEKEHQSEAIVIKDTVKKENDSVVVQQPEIKVNDSLDAMAQLIAGTYTGEHYKAVTASKEYREFSGSFSRRWTEFDSSRILRLKEFRDKELTKEISSKPTLFYPFSGPDILYADLFFPQAEKFILVGLEPVGTLPDLGAGSDSLKDYYNKLNSSLNAILKFSFFRTESMSKDLKNAEVDGTLHLLLLFLSRTGNSIVSARPVTIDSLGNKEYLPSFEALKTGKLKTKGVEVVFKTDDNKVKELNYFSLNVVDPMLKRNAGFKHYLENLEDFDVYLKGASYLLHKTYFSIVRNTILDKASTIVQDDSGIALHYFEKTKQPWDFKLYGQYTKPISLFKKEYQKDLDSLYKKQGATPLGFGIGYNFKDKNSNLMVAKSKRSA
jgi:hypothetical protein